MTPIRSACQERNCARFFEARVVAGRVVFKCQAFPKGIPQPIYLGENLHIDNYPGDDGLTYEPAKRP